MADQIPGPMAWPAGLEYPVEIVPKSSRNNLAPREGKSSRWTSAIVSS